MVSVATVWELAIKRALGKLDSPPDLLDQLRVNGFMTLVVTAPHAIPAAVLPLLHKDPFDRMLVAQAQIEGMTIVTRDAAISRYQVAVLPA